MNPLDFFVTIGEFFRPWGWGYCRFDWDSHVVSHQQCPLAADLDQPA